MRGDKGWPAACAGRARVSGSLYANEPISDLISPNASSCASISSECMVEKRCIG